MTEAVSLGACVALPAENAAVWLAWVRRAAEAGVHPPERLRADVAALGVAARELARARAVAGPVVLRPIPDPGPPSNGEVSADRAAEILGCSTRHVRRLARANRVPARMVAGRWYFQLREGCRSGGTQAGSEAAGAGGDTTG